MTNEERKVFELALEALESCDAAHITDGGRQWYDERLVDKAIDTIEEALAQQAVVEHDLAAAYRTELDKLSQRNYELRMENAQLKAQPKEPEQEPVGSLSVRYHRGCKSMTNTDFDYNGDLPEGDYELYTTPPQRKPLTEEQMDAMIDGCPKYHGRFSTKDPDGKLNYYELIRAIEAAHGIKE